MLITKLTIIDFDNMENIETEVIREEKYFQDKDGFTGHYYAGEYIKNYNVKLYLGWNNHVYPRFKLQDIYLENK